MGLFSAGKAFLRGDIQDAFNLAFIDEDAIETQELVANGQQAILARQHAEGLVDDEEAAQLQKEIQLTAYTEVLRSDEIGETPLEVFSRSIREDIDAVGKGVAKGITGVVGAASKFLPWWVYVIAGLGLLIYLTPVLAPIIRVGLANRGR